MKTFEVGIFDNDYRSLISRITVNAKDKDTVRTWCDEQSWTGESYVCCEEYSWVSSSPDILIEKSA
jgi:hypothetical protein